MNRKTIFTFIAIYSIAAGSAFIFSDDEQRLTSTMASDQASYILLGESTEHDAQAVHAVDGEITHEFQVINAVTAMLTPDQRERLQQNSAVLAINEHAPIKSAIPAS